MYIATFYTHFGAQSFYSGIKKRDPAAVMAPVPRALSASCGICVRFEQDLTAELTARPPEDLEALYCEVQCPGSSGAADGSAGRNRSPVSGYETLLEIE